ATYAGSTHTIISEGSTILEAMRSAQTVSERKIYFGHTSYIIFGEDVVKEDVGKHMDFISRGMEARLNQALYVAKESTANEFIIQSLESHHSLPDVLKHMQ